MRKWWNNLVRWLARHEIAELTRRANVAEGALSTAQFAYKQAREELGIVQARNQTLEKRCDEYFAVGTKLGEECETLKQTLADATRAFDAKLAQVAVSAFETEYAEEAPQMNRDLRGVWRQFLNSNEAGRTLKRLANYYEQAQNRMAVLRNGEEARKAGFAHGWHACTRYFFNDLSVDVLPQTDNDTPASEADALRERFAS